MVSASMALKILLTTLELETYSGLPLYTRDMALELKRQGHFPQVYTLKDGGVADELRAADIQVTDNPSHLNFEPDIIHGQHRVSTMIAVKQFRRSPAIFINHNHTFWGDQAPFHPRIRQYFGVSRVCMEKLKKDGVPEDRIHFLANFVDINRFISRGKLPEKPRRALVFSNSANDQTHLPVIKEACRQAGLELDAIGIHTNYILKPETVLGKYDIIFAKAKAAMEAMAVGSAVILCDYAGAGPMVTSGEFYNLRLMNFGFQSLTKPLHPEYLLSQIALYDPEDALTVHNLMRTTGSLEDAARKLAVTYQAVINDYKKNKTIKTVKGTVMSFNELVYWERARFWASLTLKQKQHLKLFHEKDDAAREIEYVFFREDDPGEYKFLLRKLSESTFDYLQKHYKLRVKITAASNYILAGLLKIILQIWMSFSPDYRMKIKKLTLISLLLKPVKRFLNLQ
jgi:Glycosyltransferase Family 4